jgi:hypothetical protein
MGVAGTAAPTKARDSANVRIKTAAITTAGWLRRLMKIEELSNELCLNY